MDRDGFRVPAADLQAAVLDLHATDLDVHALGTVLEEVVVKLGLARTAVFLPLALTAEVPTRADGIALAVPGRGRRPAGVLRCTEAVAGPDLELVVAHAAVAFENLSLREEIARREEAVRRIAEQLQDALLPDLPSLPNTLIDVRYRSAGREARVGGDFYDVFGLPDGRALIVVGDVMGKGVEAASRTSRITQTLRALALQGLDLQLLLERCHEQVTYQDPEIMATLWCGLYDPESGELDFASLGHPPALLLRGGDDPSRSDPIRLELEGLPLGLRDLTDTPPETRSRRLGPRDLLVLYTDGVVEASGDFLAGVDALLAAVEARADEPLATIVSEVVDEMLADAGHRDDAVLFLLRRR